MGPKKTAGIIIEEKSAPIRAAHFRRVALVGRRKLTQEETKIIRDAILKQGQILFLAHDYDGLSLRSIAAAAGSSAMTPYSHFTNKADIFNVVRFEAFERFASQQGSKGKEEAVPKNRIRAIAQAYVNFAKQCTNEFRLMFELDLSEEPSKRLR